MSGGEGRQASESRNDISFELGGIMRDGYFLE